MRTAMMGNVDRVRLSRWVYYILDLNLKMDTLSLPPPDEIIHLWKLGSLDLSKYQAITLTDEEDIEALVESLTSSDIDVKYIYPVEKCDAVSMIRHGLVPMHYKKLLNKPQFIRYVKFRDDTPNFTKKQYTNLLYSIHFFDSDVYNFITKMETIPVWVYRPVKYYIDKAEKTSNSVPLCFVAPHLMYHSSRPKTNMMTFYTSNNIRIRRSSLQLVDSPDSEGLIVYQVKVSNVIFHGIPVTRYVKGMSKGLFYDERPPTVCGTFYYYEPESDTLLLYKPGHLRQYFNKTDALQKITSSWTDTPQYPFFMRIRAHIDGKLPADLRMTPAEVTKALGKKALLEDMDTTPQYAGIVLNMYAKEDGYDQQLCQVARSVSIDILVLTNMVGSFQTVTEILDTRNNALSYRSLAYVI